MCSYDSTIYFYLKCVCVRVRVRVRVYKIIFLRKYVCEENFLKLLIYFIYLILWKNF